MRRFWVIENRGGASAASGQVRQAATAIATAAIVRIDCESSFPVRSSLQHASATALMRIDCTRLESYRRFVDRAVAARGLCADAAAR